MAPLRQRQSVSKERFSAYFGSLKIQPYHDPGSRGAGSHRCVPFLLVFEITSVLFTFILLLCHRGAYIQSTFLVVTSNFCNVLISSRISDGTSIRFADEIPFESEQGSCPFRTYSPSHSVVPSVYQEDRYNVNLEAPPFTSPVIYLL